MRNEIKRAALYEVAKKHLTYFLSTLQKEILPISFGWQDRGCRVAANVGWFDPEMDDEVGGFYGTTPGLYITSEVGEYLIWLPKSTKAYDTFYSVMVQLCEMENLLKDSITDEIMFDLVDDSVINVKIVTYVYDVTNETEMKSAKTVANMLKDMLSDYEIFDKIELYEGDDEPDEDHVYKPGDQLPENYYVGIKTRYDFYEVK